MTNIFIIHLTILIFGGWGVVVQVEVSDLEVI